MLALLLALPLLQADPRHELGWRMQEFERAWSAEASRARRAEVIAHWERATQAFFAGRHDQAARALDEGRRQLLGETPSWADGLALAPEARLLELGAPTVTLELSAFYPLELPASVELHLASSDWHAAVESLPWSGAVPLPRGAAGPLALEFELRAADVPAARRVVSLARVERLEERVEALATWVQGQGSGPGLLRATVRGLHASLEGLTWDGSGETFVDGARLLATAEEIVEHGALPPGAERLWLRLGERDVALRVRIPAVAAGRRVPLVLALHGAGGSENLFFEGYGNGASVALAAERGWALVAPRLAFDAPPDLAALVAALARDLPIDPERVVLVGHSMGAMLASSALNARPVAFRGAALLAGAGGGPRPADAWRDLPLFLATAERDFARAGVERLQRELEASGATRLTFRLYPASEHLTVVGEALPDVFAFFDGLLAD